MRSTSIALLAIAMSAGTACTHVAPVAASCPAPGAAAAEVVQTMRDMYAALKADDAQGFQAVTTQDFFSFDGGKRFDGGALVDLIKAAHGRGAVYDWQINDPQVEATCGTALVTYTNTGSLTQAGETRALSWLESAVLIHDGQRWRIRFFHSTRVPQG